MQVLTAVLMTSAIPIIFSPVCIDGKCFIDGGIVNNYPLNYCLKDHPEIDDILTFNNVYVETAPNIGEDSTVVDVFILLFQRLLKKVNIITNVVMPFQIMQSSEVLSIEYLQNTLVSESFRQGLLNEGIQTAILFKQTLAKTEEASPL